MPPAPRRVLDLGCGDGRLASLVLSQRASVEHVLAVDISPPMLERAARRRRALSDPPRRAAANRPRFDREAAMAHEATIRRMFDEVINRGDVDVVDELFDADFETVTPQGTFDREGFKAYVTQWRAGFPDIRCEVCDVIEQGDRIAWRVRAVGTHDGEFAGVPPTGRTVDFDSLNQATMRDGRGWRHIVVMDTLAVMAQLGAVPTP